MVRGVDEREAEDSGPDESEGGIFAAEKLRSLVGRIEQLHTERDGLAEDISAVMKEVKKAGFNVDAFKTLLKRRRKTPTANADLDATVVMYEQAMAESDAPHSTH